MQEHHEFLLPSLAAGLFVDPDPSPVLANYGLDSLRVIEPTQPGQSIKGQAHRKKSPRNKHWSAGSTKRMSTIHLAICESQEL